MKRAFTWIVIGLFVLAAGSAWSQTKGSSAAQAKLWVEKAAKYVEEVGLKAALAEFNNPKGKFVKGDLYVNAFRFDGKVVAFPLDHSKMGLNRMDYKDEDGKYIVRAFIDVAKTKGAGWVDYKYINRKTNQIGQKTGYVKKVADDVLIVCAADK